MNKPTEILYPRQDAQIRVAKSRREPVIVKRIAEIEASTIYLELLRLRDELIAVQRAKPTFICWSCSNKALLKDLVLYDFVIQGDEYNHDTSHDPNIICPKCGAFSRVTDAGKYVIDYRFKAKEEIDQKSWW